MVYHARKEASSEDAITFLNTELHTDVKKEFPYVDAWEFDNQRRCIEAGMLHSSVHLNLRDSNADAIKYGRPRIWPEVVAESQPQGATHVSEFYGEAHYYKQVERQHLNQVSEEWSTLTDWFSWNTKAQKWEGVGEGFSPRCLIAIEATQKAQKPQGASRPGM